MIKVFLVEDEFIVREGIKNNIDWEKHGYEFCGEAGDGELAYPMIQKLQPDIVITDIKIPFMDGLELSRLIKKEFPWIEIIILSGYEEFEYAKEAIKIGVAQYLTKPISGDELLKEVDALSEIVREKNEERELKERYKREMQEIEQMERKDFFQHLVSGQKSVPELLEMADSMELDLSSLWYNIVLIKLQSMNHSSVTEYSKTIVDIEQELNDSVYRNRFLVFDRNLDGKAILIKADSEEELKKLQETFVREFCEIADKYGYIRYSIGLGVGVCRMSELPVSFAKASHAFAHRFFDNESRIIDGAALESGLKYVTQDEIAVSDIDSSNFDRKKVKDFLKLGAEAETRYFVDEFYNDIGMEAIASNVFRQYIVMDVYFCVVEFVEGLSFGKEEIEPVDSKVENLTSIEGAIAYTVRIIEKAVELREKVASNKYGDIVNDVMDYIDNHYSDDELSLNSIASYVRFSPNHLSTIFSQQTGQTLIKYLTDYRLEKAKEMLKCTSKRSSEIALEVGYKDPHYFSYLFKKSLGVTPTQYRTGKASDEAE